jgi:hypothetical protein
MLLSCFCNKIIIRSHCAHIMFFFFFLLFHDLDLKLHLHVFMQLEILLFNSFHGHKILVLPPLPFFLKEVLSKNV